MKAKFLTLPHNLCTAFMQWMLNGGHIGKVNKVAVVLKKGTNVAKIFCDGNNQPFYEMNEYCATRYELFLKQWFVQGVQFIQGLTTRANQVIQQKLLKTHSANYQKFMAQGDFMEWILLFVEVLLVVNGTIVINFEVWSW